MEHKCCDTPATLPLWPDVATVLGIGRSTAYELVRTGEFPIRVLRLGKKLRVSTVDLDRYLSGHRDRAA
ncbi:helix-turn-helix domain-containing protein [Kocuria sp. M4R2S49]|uniref:helix-turn-helix domain-containing protein n=1 Tax=Kocuria rhizosphaericola TaxID=3376284 RepID=UPI00378D0EA2